MSKESDLPTLQERVDALARHRLGASAPVTELQALTAGANKGTWSFRCGDAEFILQRQAPSGAPDPTAGPDDWVPHLDGTAEFHLMKAAQAAGVPVPNVRHILTPEDGLGEGAVTDHIVGETIPARVLRLPELADARRRMAAQCGRIMAGIHQVRVDGMAALRLMDAPSTLALYRRVIDGFELPLPALELALRWARERLPRTPRCTLVHADFRTGNLIVGPEGVRAVLDWETAHLGDPIQDLGYVCMRTWRFGGPGAVGGFGQRSDLFEAYERASGVRIDPGEVRFWEAVAAMRWALGCVRRAHAWRYQGEKKLEFAAVGRRIEEPVYDLLNVIEERD